MSAMAVSFGRSNKVRISLLELQHECGRLWRSGRVNLGLWDGWFVRTSGTRTWNPLSSLRGWGGLDTTVVILSTAETEPRAYDDQSGWIAFYAMYFDRI